MTLDPKIWGPHYWFFLLTLALVYPATPNQVIKKKYYDFYQNLPLFLPIPQIGNKFAQFLDTYPVTPYLESRESLVRWTHFIHNQINKSLDIPEISLEKALSNYYNSYKPKEVKNKKQRKFREKIAYSLFIFFILILTYFLYQK